MPGESTHNSAMLRAESSPNAAHDVSAEIVNSQPMTADVFPDFAVSLEETARRVKMLQQYVREHMVEGEDFGVIPGSTKPTLFKPGAEKLNSVFGLAPIVEITNRIEDWDKGFVSYEIKVTLINKRTQQIEAEGIGSCNSKERRYARQDAPSISNTVLKMAKKRALIDATLSATRASGLFTQDLEDMDDVRGGGNWNSNAPRQEPRRATNIDNRNGDGRSSENRPEPKRDAGRDGGEQSTPAEARPAQSGTPSGGWSGGDNYLTDAQHRAILAIAGRVFGRPATAEDFAQLTEKPVEELTKGEASSLIDRLRFRLAEQQGAPSGARGGRDNSFNRSAQRNDQPNGQNR
jgi:hypothetical protein